MGKLNGVVNALVMFLPLLKWQSEGNAREPRRFFQRGLRTDSASIQRAPYELKRRKIKRDAALEVLLYEDRS